MNNLSISDSKRQGFALKVILWAANNGILEKLIKSESQKIKVNSERSKKHVAEYKIQSIGNIALFTVFREEAEEVELRKRCFINNIDISDYFPEKDHNYIYLSNQWNENGDNNLTLEGLVSTINSEINPDYECGFFKNQNEMYIFYVIANQNEVICKNADISPKQQEEIISSLEEVHTLSKYKANKRLSKTTKYNYLIEEFDNQSLIQKFQFRLQTQERKRYSQSKISFFTRLFNQIDKDHFSDWCNNQIDKIEYYTKDGEIISTKQISSFIVKDGCVFIKKGNDSAEFELFFKYEEEFHSFKDFISDVRYVSLDHVESMDKVLLRLRDNLPRLQELSDIIYLKYSDIDRFNVEMSKAIIKELDHSFIQGLKNELDLVGKNIRLQLMPRSLNSSKSNN